MKDLKITLQVLTNSDAFLDDPHLLGQFADRAMQPSFKEGYSVALYDDNGKNVGIARVEALLPEDIS